jgi:hypothetical protein
MTQYAAVLLSRQPLRPTGGTAWVRQSRAAVRWLREHGYGLSSSIGMQTWEMLTTLAAKNSVPMRLYLPAVSESDLAALYASLTRQFDLDPQLVEFVPVIPLNSDSTRESQMSRRDRMIIKDADLLIPIALRKSGNMAALLAEAVASGKQMESRFQVPHRSRTQPMATDLDGCTLNPALVAIEDDYIIHWTRATNDAWPGELLRDFYEAILNSKTWPRSGFETLNRIAATGELIASSWRMPGGMATVSFSALPPREVVPLMRWRARYRQMSFEPYGVGISRHYAEQAGIRPVKYYEAANKVKTPDAERWLYQSMGRITDWRAEKEYRCLGNLCLKDRSRIPDSLKAITLFCRMAEEADIMRHRYPYDVISFLP